MTVKETFDNWYSKLSSNDQRELIQYILESKLRPATEGYNAGPSGLVLDGVYAGPVGHSKFSDNVTSNNKDQDKCPYCGK